MVRIGLCAGILSLFCFISIGVGLAQAHELVSVGGSGIVNAVIEELVRASGTSSADVIGLNSSGTVRGIEQFCAGELDVATASRKMTSDERASCEAEQIAHSEFLIGHHIVAFVAHPEAPAQCLQFGSLQDALKPTASNVVSDWSFYRENDADLPLSAVLPGENELTYVIVDSMVAGDGFRLDGQHYEAPSEAISIVADRPGTLALVPWHDQLEHNESIKLLEIGGDLGACSLPSAENVESESYPFALSLYVYVNRARLDSNDRLSEFMQYSISEASAAVIEAAGAIPPSSTIYDLNAKVLADADAEPGYSGDVDHFQIPIDLSGEIHIVGAANAHQVLSRAGEDLSEQLNIDFRYAGIAAGISSLCEGEADIAALESPAEADTLTECATNGVVTIPVNLGAQATVLVGNAADEYSACLTTDQINTIWRADSTGLVESWPDVADAFPDQPLTLFGLSSLDTYTDILLQTAGETIPPVRRDTEKDFAPLYRAAAVGNVSGGLTYMSWHDYQTVLENEQANIQLVAVDSGSGCVEPNRGTIEGGMYSLSRRANLLISEASLADINIQVFLWNLFDEDNWTALQRDGFLSASVLELPIMRREIMRRYADAESRYPSIEDNTEPDNENEPADADVDDSAG